MYLTVKKVLVSGLLVTTIHDLIKGFSSDLFAPMLDSVIPGNITKPVKIGGLRLYITRFLIRLINVLCALLVVYYINKKQYYNY